MMSVENFKNMISGLEQRLSSGSEQTIARKRFALEVSRFGLSLYSGEHHLAWCGVLAPYELLSAMGVRACCMEYFGALLSSVGVIGNSLRQAEELGCSPDSCAFHRSAIGAVQAGLVPEPDFLIAVSVPCSGGLAAIETLAHQLKKDLFTLHVPHHHTDESVGFVAQQLRELVDFIQAHTGTSLDKGELSRAIEITNLSREILIDVLHMAQTIPSPSRPKDLANLGVVLPLLSGQESLLEIVKTYQDEFRRKVREGIAGVPGERIRLMWLQNRLQFNNPIERLLAQEHFASIVIDELNQIEWDPIDPDDPFKGIAERILSFPMVGPVERRTKLIKKMARLYHVDGVINPCHWGCRQGTGARGLIANSLQEDQLPVLNLEVDCLDPDNFSEGQVRTRIDAFIEMIGSNKRVHTR